MPAHYPNPLRLGPRRAARFAAPVAAKRPLAVTLALWTFEAGAKPARPPSWIARLLARIAPVARLARIRVSRK